MTPPIAPNDNAVPNVLNSPILQFSADEIDQKVAALFADNQVDIQFDPCQGLDWVEASKQLALKLCSKHGVKWLSLAVSDASAWHIVIAIIREHVDGFKLLSEIHASKGGAKGKQVGHASLIVVAVGEVSRALEIVNRYPESLGKAMALCKAGMFRVLSEHQRFRKIVETAHDKGWSERAYEFLTAYCFNPVLFDLASDEDSSIDLPVDLGIAALQDWEGLDEKRRRQRLAWLARELWLHRDTLNRFAAQFPDGPGDLKQAMKAIKDRSKDEERFRHEVISTYGNLARRVESWLMSLPDDAARIKRVSVISVRLIAESNRKRNIVNC